MVRLDLYPFLVVDPVCDLDEALVGSDVGCLVGFLGSGVGCLVGYLVNSLEYLVVVLVNGVGQHNFLLSYYDLGHELCDWPTYLAG